MIDELIDKQVEENVTDTPTEDDQTLESIISTIDVRDEYVLMDRLTVADRKLCHLSDVPDLEIKDYPDHVQPMCGWSPKTAIIPQGVKAVDE